MFSESSEPSEPYHVKEHTNLIQTVKFERDWREGN